MSIASNTLRRAPAASRLFSTSSLSRAEAADSRTDAVAALRKAVANSQVRMQKQREKNLRQDSLPSKRRENTKPRQKQSSSKGTQSRDGTRPASLKSRKSSPSVLRKDRGTRIQQTEEPAPLANIVPSTNWNAAPDTTVYFSRAPFAKPAVDPSSLNKNYDAKRLRPLHDASQALRLHVFPGRGAYKGDLNHPPPFARQGKSDSSLPLTLLPKDGQGGQSGITSIASEAREARRKAVQETIGGDYSRWLPSSFGRANEPQSHALALNDDLGPTLKTWVHDQIKLIMSNNSTSGKAGKKIA